MRFDETFIAIRERGTLEIFDLALHVIVDHFKPLFWLLLIGTLPWIVLDYYLIGWIATSDFFDASLYYWVMMLLIASQAHVGTTFMTRYLGQAMFEGRPSVGTTVKEVLFQTSLYYVWSQGILRCVLPVLLCCLMFSHDSEELSFFAGALLIPGLVVLGLFVRALRPFVSEILLLERTPIHSKDPNRIFFSKRSSTLHASASGELIGRMIVALVFVLPLAFSCFALFAITDSTLNIQANNLEFTFYPFYWIVSLWMVAGFFCVIRFLSYIDTRIRQEGWAVELRMRAEGQRLARELE